MSPSGLIPRLNRSLGMRLQVAQLTFKNVTFNFSTTTYFLFIKLCQQEIYT